MSAQGKTERAKRLERWAEAAMSAILKDVVWRRDDDDRIEKQTDLARGCWDIAVAMEDERTRVLTALRHLDPAEAS